MPSDFSTFKKYIMRPNIDDNMIITICWTTVPVQLVIEVINETK